LLKYSYNKVWNVLQKVFYILRSVLCFELFINTFVKSEKFKLKTENKHTVHCKHNKDFCETVCITETVSSVSVILGSPIPAIFSFPCFFLEFVCLNVMKLFSYLEKGVPYLINSFDQFPSLSIPLLFTFCFLLTL
jgi:hypothetical protein